MEILEDQLEADPADDDECAVDQRRIPFHQRQQAADDEPHHQDTEDAAGEDDPQLRRHGHGDENRIDSEHDVGQLDFDDCRPEGGQSQPRLRRFRFAAVGAALAAGEMPVDEVQKIPRPEQLHPGKADQKGREQRGDRAEAEGAENAVSQRISLFALRQAEHEHREHHRVVGAQQPLQRHQERDGQKISRLNHTP